MRPLLLGSAALLVVGASTLVYAQQRPMPPDGPRRPMFSAEDRSAFVDARIAALHAGLRLSPEQDKNWPAFEQASRDFAALRTQRMTDGPAAPAGTPVERMAKRADMLTKHGEAMKKLADAAAPLYNSLDDAQKRRFAMLSRLGGPRGMGPHRMGPGMGPGMDGPGPGMMGPRRGEPGPDFGPRERFGMTGPRDPRFSENFDRPNLRERFERWRQRSLAPALPREPVEGEERL